MGGEELQPCPSASGEPLPRSQACATHMQPQPACTQPPTHQCVPFLDGRGAVQAHKGVASVTAQLHKWVRERAAGGHTRSVCACEGEAAVGLAVQGGDGPCA